MLEVINYLSFSFTIMTMALKVPEVSAFLRSRHVRVVDEWTVECLDWLQQEYQGQNVRPDEMKQHVYDQWLDSDLGEVASPALPPGIAQQKKTQLTGSYALQINSIQDISQPAYGQLLKLQGRENENALVSATQATQPTQSKFEQKSSRMLMLQLTDGHQSLEGMEFQPISQLSVDTLPGTKILVHGSVQCRMGVLMLTANNIRVLGGDAESLAEANSQIQILSRALGLDESQQTQQAPVPTASSQRPPVPRVTVDLTGDSEGRNASTSSGQMQNANQFGSHGNAASSGEEDGFFSDDLGDDLDALMLNEIEKIEEMDQMQQLASSAGEETDWPADDDEIDEMWLEQVEQTHGIQASDRPGGQPARTDNQAQHASLINHPASNAGAPKQAAQQHSSLSSSCRIRQDLKDVNTKTEPQSMKKVNNSQPMSNRTSHDGVQRFDMWTRSSASDKKECRNAFQTNAQDSIKDAWSNIKTEPGSSKNAVQDTNIDIISRTSSHHAGKAIASGYSDREASLHVDSKNTLQHLAPSVSGFPQRANTTVLDTKPLVDVQQKARLSGRSTLQSDSTVPSTIFQKLPTGCTKPAQAAGIAARITKDPLPANLNNNAKNLLGLATSSFAEAHRAVGGPVDSETNSEDGFSAAKRRRFHSNEGGQAVNGVDSFPVVKLSSVMNRIQAEEVFEFAIKGFIVTLISPLSKNDGSWSISAKISDKTASLDVSLSNEVLTGLIGFSVPEMMQIKKTIKTSDPTTAKELETKLRQGLAQCQKSLIDIHCAMTVRVDGNQDRPQVIAVGRTDPADLATNFRKVPSKT
ncbi:recQ-mediated genome instability protein 1-like isoform X2 [Acanthaster planci]|uniref:RecQ-mediated genome instability protein 1 n=1 Tax=Acanthaster planci TaxID=133434 RepID=A0A8B7ZP74_ACAPL|nr:recQ-mediated genome instability protein 1-like isoform X2 [Acanthaster planci]